MNRKRLYIIGNGFDLYHGLRTRYSDFNEYLVQNDRELEFFFEQYFTFETDVNYFWTNFEADLGTFNYMSFYEYHNDLDPMDDSFRPRDCFCLEDTITMEIEEIIDKIKKTFSDWISNVYKESILKSSNVKLQYLDNQAIYLTFNYTDTLTRVYTIERTNITYIHNDIERYGEGIILGHNTEIEDIPEIDENGEGMRTLFSDSEKASQSLLHALRKPINEIIDNHVNFFEDIKEVSEIVILGHSINKIDLPYFKKIHNTVSPSALWRVSYYKDDEQTAHKQSLMSIEIKEHHIALFKMEDYEK